MTERRPSLVRVGRASDVRTKAGRSLLFETEHSSRYLQCLHVLRGESRTQKPWKGSIKGRKAPRVSYGLVIEINTNYNGGWPVRYGCQLQLSYNPKGWLIG